MSYERKTRVITELTEQTLLLLFRHLEFFVEEGRDPNRAWNDTSPWKTGGIAATQKATTSLSMFDATKLRQEAGALFRPIADRLQAIQLVRFYLSKYMMWE